MRPRTQTRGLAWALTPFYALSPAVKIESIFPIVPMKKIFLFSWLLSSPLRWMFLSLIFHRGGFLSNAEHFMYSGLGVKKLLKYRRSWFFKALFHAGLRPYFWKIGMNHRKPLKSWKSRLILPLCVVGFSCSHWMFFMQCERARNIGRM